MSDWIHVCMPNFGKCGPSGTWWVRILVDIRHTSTGGVRTYDTQGLLEHGTDDLSTYIWEEGNYSCDCNRRLFFRRAAGEPDGDDDACGDGEYLVRIRNPLNGAIVYDEWAP